MSHRTLPERPDIEQLKRQAKELRRLSAAGDPTALERFRILPAFAGHSAKELSIAVPALHDAQSVMAREHGFPSWKALAERVEELSLQRDQAVVAFVEAATDGRSGRAQRLLARYPDLGDTDFHSALVLGDAAQVDAWLTRNPALAQQPGGPRDWQPLHYVCHTAMHAVGVADADGLVAITRQLLALGGDARLRFPWEHHGVHRPLLWGAMLVTRSMPLAEVLLAAGADPNDGVTLPILASGGNTVELDFLHAHGASANQRWATDGAATLYAILQWSDAIDGVRWLLEHGADADPVFEPNGESPLHVAARRSDVATVELLAARGANLSRRRSDGLTPYAVAALNGNTAVADWLAQHGASAELEPVDRLIAAASRGERAAVGVMLAEHPALREQIRADHYAALYQAAERNDTNAIDALLACGLDIDRGDEDIGKTALHCAAMSGQVEAVRLLLDRGASTTVRDREFHAQPLVWAAEGSRMANHDDARHAAVGHLLLDAGSPVAWQ
ncbi:MAG: ankyrin repeat domain-containing protein, partial [Rhodanobacter sp.]